MTVVHLKAKSLREAVSSNAVVLYHASYCGWCKKFAPTYAAFANEVREAKLPFHVAAIEMQKHGESVRPLLGGSVRGYPTVILYREGHEPKKFEGERSVEALLRATREHYGIAAGAGGDGWKRSYHGVKRDTMDRRRKGTERRRQEMLQRQREARQQRRESRVKVRNREERGFRREKRAEIRRIAMRNAKEKKERQREEFEEGMRKRKEFAKRKYDEWLNVKYTKFEGQLEGRHEDFIEDWERAKDYPESTKGKPNERNYEKYPLHHLIITDSYCLTETKTPYGEGYVIRDMVLEYVLENKLHSVNARDPKNRTPLHYAIGGCFTNEDQKEGLIPRHIVVGQWGDGGEPYLHIMNMEAVKILLRYGADLLAEDKYGDSPLVYLAQRRNHYVMEEILKYLKEKLKKDSSTLTTYLSHFLDASIRGRAANAKPMEKDKKDEEDEYNCEWFPQTWVVARIMIKYPHYLNDDVKMRGEKMLRDEFYSKEFGRYVYSDIDDLRKSIFGGYDPDDKEYKWLRSIVGEERPDYMDV